MKWLRWLDILMLMMLMMAVSVKGSIPAHAQATVTPTNTPTVTAYPSPTAMFGQGGLFETPTPYSITPSAPRFDTAPHVESLANGAINAYRFINRGGIIDYAITAGLGYFVARLLMGIIRTKDG